MAIGNAILKNGGIPTKSIIYAATYLRQQNSVPKLKPRHRPFILWSDIQIISFAY